MSPAYPPIFELLTGALPLVATFVLVSILEAAFPFRQAMGAGRKWTNLGLVLLFFLVNVLLTLAAYEAAGNLASPLYDMSANFELPGLVWLGIAIVVLDFSAWLAHWSMHKIGVLWRVHRVHHSDVHVDATTAFRQHPLETVWRFAFTLLPAALLGLPAASVAGYRLVSGVNALFEHMNFQLWPGLERLLVTVFVTPNMHKLHHSRVPVETDSNYANILSVFDRLFGTFTPSRGARNCTYGLDGYEGGESVLSLLKLPFARSA